MLLPPALWEPHETKEHDSSAINYWFHLILWGEDTHDPNKIFSVHIWKSVWKSRGRRNQERQIFFFSRMLSISWADAPQCVSVRFCRDKLSGFSLKQTQPRRKAAFCVWVRSTVISLFQQSKCILFTLLKIYIFFKASNISEIHKCFWCPHCWGVTETKLYSEYSQERMFNYL